MQLVHVAASGQLVHLIGQAWQVLVAEFRKVLIEHLETHWPFKIKVILLQLVHSVDDKPEQVTQLGSQRLHILLAFANVPVGHDKPQELFEGLR